MKLSTDRLLIKKATLKDGSFFYKLLNTPTWLTYIGDRNIFNEKAAEVYIKESLLKSYEQNGFGLYKVLLKTNHAPVGICGLVKRTELEYPDLGFALLPEYEGNGYIFEASLAAVKYAKKLNLPKVLAITTEDNRKARNVINKLGFSFKGKMQLNEEALSLLVFELPLV